MESKDRHKFLKFAFHTICVLCFKKIHTWDRQPNTQANTPTRPATTTMTPSPENIRNVGTPCHASLIYKSAGMMQPSQLIATAPVIFRGYERGSTAAWLLPAGAHALTSDSTANIIKTTAARSKPIIALPRPGASLSSFSSSSSSSSSFSCQAPFPRAAATPAQEDQTCRP